MKLYPNINKIFIIWLVSVLLVSYFGFSTLPHSGKFSNNFFSNLANWDGGHFLGIAEKGYSEKFQYAFFPFYPLLINVLNKIINNYLISAIFISVGSTFLGLHYFCKLVQSDFKKQIAEKAVIVLLFFPTSFFFLTAYSEGLFFLLTVLTFYFLRKNKLFWAVVFASLASATRLVGLAVAAAVIIDVLGKDGINRKNWYVFFAILGFVIYSIFLYRQTGDPFYFITAENHWQRILVAPGVGFWEALKNMPTGILDLGFAIFGLGFAIRAFRFLPSVYAIYGLLSVVIPLFTPTLTSSPRFLLPVFPIFILMAFVKNQYFVLFFQVISLMLLGIFSVMFVTGYWVS
ncbi:MAG: mannosyltransferase family protein [Candidatus Daviesbacteria bacterium]|nr:mannosyltransferase family protein [Candidatus Daviesbacteria bacterium]